MTATLRFAIAAAIIFVLAACAAPRQPAQHESSTAASAPADLDQPGAQRLLAEVQREVAAMRTTRYQHETEVDESSGTYFYDCSGLVDYAARQALPADARDLPTSTSTRPLAGDIERYLHRGLHQTLEGWTTIRRVEELRPGDVIAWLATEDSTTGDTGHTMIVLAAPQPNPARPGEWLIHVADSTLNPHAEDSRHEGITGLGTGTIGLVADDHGHPTAFYWRGGLSRTPKATEVALGQPD